MLTLKECLTMAGMSEEEAEKIVHGAGMSFILSGGLAPFVQNDGEPGHGGRRGGGGTTARKAPGKSADRP